MYYQVLSQCTHSLKNVETWLDKAEQHAAAKKFDVSVLLNARLAPDMKNFIYQVSPKRLRLCQGCGCLAFRANTAWA